MLAMMTYKMLSKGQNPLLFLVAVVQVQTFVKHCILIISDNATLLELEPTKVDLEHSKHTNTRRCHYFGLSSCQNTIYSQEKKEGERMCLGVGSGGAGGRHGEKPV